MLQKIKGVMKGKSVARIFMDEDMKNFSVRGKTLDIGGARKPDYIHEIKKDSDFSLEIIDGLLNPINFEKDALPFGDATFDSALMCNVLEHIYNHNFLVAEAHRILKPGGSLVGFVPFLVQYHPDPEDYFRYTEKALHIIFEKANFTNIVVRRVGVGPFMVHCNNLLQRLPLFIRPFFFAWNYALDSLYAKLKPNVKKHFPLGYSFHVVKRT